MEQHASPRREPEHLNTIAYSVEGPEQQRRLVAELAAVVERHVRHWPGFESAEFHVSTDGNRVVNHTRWADTAAYQDFAERSETGPRMRDIERAVAEVPGAVFEGFHSYRRLRTVRPEPSDRDGGPSSR